MQAGTRVNAEQAPKWPMWEPTLLNLGESLRQSEKKSDTGTEPFPPGERRDAVSFNDP